MYSKKRNTTEQSLMEHGWSFVGREWGLYLKRNIQYPKASHYFQRALKVNPEHTRTLLESSRCKFNQCQTKNALDDVTKSMKIDPKNVKSKHQFAKCLYNLNEMESAFSVAHEIAAENPTNTDIRHTKDAIEMSLRKAFCPSAQPILRKYKMHLNDTWNEKQNVNAILPTPVLEERQKAIELMKHKLYFDSKFAEQLDFWKCVQLDKTLDKELHEIIDRIIGNLNTHENMLYSREPIYAKRNRFDLKSLRKLRERQFYYAQEETRREALWQFKRIKELAVRDFSASLALVERVLSEFYAVKRRAIFPAKFEFISNIVHFVGLRYVKINQKIVCDLMSLKTRDRLIALFNVWGPMLQEEDLCDKKVSQSLKRLSYADYDVEKAYIYHQLSEICFRFRRPEESQRYARDALAYANKCNSNIWRFLGYYNIVRVDAMKHNYLPIKDDLGEMQRIADNLDTFTQVFVNTAIRSYEDIRRK